MIVDDILITGIPTVVGKIINLIDNRFKHGTLGSGPGHLGYFGFNIL